ncbi:PDZ domain-containing protein [uncultured Flavobacterium sp.]|uniref:PDZ domain-containing protein n=1 Tax=uncultured Flavobacterium sp. TaxID=165435 RepID=UPI0030CA2D08
MKKFIFCVFVYIFVSCTNKIVKEKSLNFEYDGYILLNLKLDNKRQGIFIYDTGSPFLCIDSLYYLNSNFYHKKLMHAKAGGIGNTTQTIKVVLDTINYSINSSQNGISTKTPILNLKDIAGKDIDGIVGIETFFDKMYKIDYIAEKITFVLDAKKHHLVPVEFENNRSYIYLEIVLKDENKIKGKFLIDSGSGATIINSSFFKEYNIENSSFLKAKYTTIGGVGGESAGYSFFTKNIIFDKYSISNFVIDISTDTLGALSNREYIGIVGNDILEKFDVIFNFKESKMWTKPNKSFDKKNASLFKSFSVIDRTDINKGWKVSSIYENTEAFKSGLRLNDIIIEINGIDVKKMDRKQFFTNIKPGDEMNLTVKRERQELKINFKLDQFLINEK